MASRARAGASCEDFSELIRSCGEKAYNFAYRLSGSEADARDLVGEAFAKAYENFERYDPARPFETWLFSILHNIFLDGVRRYAHGRTVSLDAPTPVEESGWDEILPGDDERPGSALERQEADGMVQRALNSLPVHYRTALTLCDIEGLSYEETSRIMACPVGTVRSRIHQGRTLLKKAYEALERSGGRLQ